MIDYKQYEHHGAMVWANTKNKGTHRENCLCWNCESFNPNDREDNCRIAELLYAVCRDHDLTTPVFECPVFIEKRG